MKPIALTLAALLLFSGCVKRSILIESDPPGAKVWVNLNEKAVGVTPVTYEFITHGKYRFRLEKAGFQSLTVREMVRAPLYQWIPLDFFFEYLLPVHLEDKHVFRYTLSPENPDERLQGETREEASLILEGLNDPNPEKRRQALTALARRRDPSTQAAVLNATRDVSPQVRGPALMVWRGLAGKEALPRLLEALSEDPDREVRWQAAAQLEVLANPDAIPGLIRALLEDKEALVRAGAAEALRGIPDPRSVEPLVKVLRDKDTSVRRSATEALGILGDRKAVKPLTKVLFHHDFETRRRAVQALAKLQDPSAAPALVQTFTDWDRKVRDVATQTLIALGNRQIVPVLIRRLRGLKPWTREHAAQVLGGLKDPAAEEPLRKALLREPDPSARIAMAQALEALERP